MKRKTVKGGGGGKGAVIEKEVDLTLWSIESLRYKYKLEPVASILDDFYKIEPHKTAFLAGFILGQHFELEKYREKK
jgi:hypothetical protein